MNRAGRPRVINSLPNICGRIHVNTHLLGCMVRVEAALRAHRCFPELEKFREVKRELQRMDRQLSGVSRLVEGSEKMFAGNILEPLASTSTSSQREILDGKVSER